MKASAKALLMFVSCTMAYWSSWTLAVGAQSNYPVRPIRVLVAYPAGGATDIIGRTVGTKLSAQLGQPVVIDNRPGAAGRLATEILAKAEPDGYTLLIVSVSIAISPSLYKKLPYDTQRDLLPLTRLAEKINVMLINSSIKVKSVKEFVHWAKQRPNDVRFGTSGVGQTSHLAGELFQRLANIRMIPVSYRGSGPALIDLSSSEIQLMFAPFGVAKPLVNDGKLRMLAVATSKRQPILPNLPTVAETFPEFTFISNWDGMFAPKKIPAPIAERLVAEVNKALQDPEVTKHLNAAGIQPAGSASFGEFATFLREETRHWAKIVRDAGIKVE